MAVDAGIEILGKGGKAIDAAVAVQAMLGLVEPQSSGIGGGGFLLYYDARTGKVSAIDGREIAPAAARPDMFLDEHGKPMAFVEAVRSGRSMGPRGAGHARHRPGAARCPALKELHPAIRAASNGFRVSARLAMFLGEGSPFPPTNEVRTLFSRPDGGTLEEGDQFRNSDYATTLQRIATEGPRALYQGTIAAAIVTAVHQEPLAGTLTVKDLAGYRTSFTQPLCRPYRAYTVCVPPPPSRGVRC
jgi:gamma-glutamyltranspeptidase/glutathione hydrolase